MYRDQICIFMQEIKYNYACKTHSVYILILIYVKVQVDLRKRGACQLAEPPFHPVAAKEALHPVRPHR